MQKRATTTEEGLRLRRRLELGCNWKRNFWLSFVLFDIKLNAYAMLDCIVQDLILLSPPSFPFFLSPFSSSSTLTSVIVAALYSALAVSWLCATFRFISLFALSNCSLIVAPLRFSFVLFRVSPYSFYSFWLVPAFFIHCKTKAHSQDVCELCKFFGFKVKLLDLLELSLLRMEEVKVLWMW